MQRRSPGRRGIWIGVMFEQQLDDLDDRNAFFILGRDAAGSVVIL